MTIRALFLLMTMLHHPAPPAPATMPHERPQAVRGVATYYDWRSGQAAAGPALRRLLGPHWRGRWVTVTAGRHRVRVRLTDWCACGPRHGRPALIDLDRRSFARLALPSTGIIEVTIRP